MRRRAAARRAAGPRRDPGENREQRRAEIVRAGLRLLEEGGIDRLSLRGVAGALGMHPPGMYWYIGNKQELVDLLAKAIMDEALAHDDGPTPGQPWEEWLTDVAVRIRRALLAHRDGARVVAGAYLFRTHAITPTLERALAVLEAEGFTRPAAMLGTITVMRYTMGIALDEQMSPPVPTMEDHVRVVRSHVLDARDENARRWPRVADMMEKFVAMTLEDPVGVGEMHFRRGLALIIAGIRSTPRLD